MLLSCIAAPIPLHGGVARFVTLLLPIDTFPLLRQGDWEYWAELGDAFPKGFQPNLGDWRCSLRARAKLYGPVPEAHGVYDMTGCFRETDPF